MLCFICTLLTLPSHSFTDVLDPLAALLAPCAPLQMMATSVVLATLSILPYERALFGRTDDLSAEQEKERTIRMATILGFSVDKRTDTKHILTRSALVTNINNMNLLAMVPAEVRQGQGQGQTGQPPPPPPLPGPRSE
jgi:hypothetical protein